MPYAVGVYLATCVVLNCCILVLWTLYVLCHKLTGIFYCCNMGMSDMPEMYAQSLRGIHFYTYMQCSVMHALKVRLWLYSK